jgi:hypothetical protein
MITIIFNSFKLIHLVDVMSFHSSRQKHQQIEILAQFVALLSIYLYHFLT